MKEITITLQDHHARQRAVKIGYEQEPNCYPEILEINGEDFRKFNRHMQEYAYEALMTELGEKENAQEAYHQYAIEEERGN